MGAFNQQAFNNFVLDQGIVGFFDNPIILKSGRRSHWYINWRNIAEDVFLLDQLTDFVIAYVGDLTASGQLEEKPLCFYGVPEGATKLGVLTQYKWAKLSADFSCGSHPLPMGRGKPKEHGAPKDKYFVGLPRGGTIVLEDTTTTGASLLSAIDALNEAGTPIIAALGLSNRMEKRDDGQSVFQAVAAKSSQGRPIPYFHLSSALDLLPELLRRRSPAPSVKAAIVAEFEQFGVSTLVLD